MSGQEIKLTINGEEHSARAGQMLIEVTDAAGIYIPRFCYHEKLSVAANCRMCLIEVENVPKPLPACATPVTDGMVVHTRSPRAIAAQKATMEFLLINHPLDCPICDQGGECELQDLAMGYGRDVSRYAERKRVVADKNLGPLISTDMTRCIHCTRCVRFGQEIAGIQELGTIGRGDRTEISTYIEASVDHELSGNIIDLCPVGALNNKPYRFSARAWEMEQRPTVAPHDCVGGNLYAHVLGGRVKRMVPRPNEAINETWASDRDRFSYQGIYADDRAPAPLLRIDGELREVNWSTALEAAVEMLQAADGDLAGLVSPSATVEEGFLLARLFAHLGSHDLDHRLRRRDFRGEQAEPAAAWLGTDLPGIERMDALLVIGSHLRHEAPLLAHRVRKAALAGARVMFLNPQRYEYLFPVAANHACSDLLAETRALAEGRSGGDLAAILSALGEAERALVLLGQQALRHPRYAELRQAAGQLAAATGSGFGLLPEGANATGLGLAGVLPTHTPGGLPRSHPGRNAAGIIASPPKTLLLLGIEPEFDCAGDAVAALAQAGRVIAMTPYLGGAVQAHADLILPIGTFAETSGTFVNAAGQWQSFPGVASPVGESRPAWKVLRVLCNLLDLPESDYDSSEEIRDELLELIGDRPLDASLPQVADLGPAKAVGGPDIVDVPIYQVDAILRRATALQATRLAREADLAGSAGVRVA
ncbi:MAG: NADH-quinone oxidoreductase subunit G [Gammaproteobacteria bacterium]|nr:MAG: NADH-quinone oxidoreductase subunit G [Gammaproteobacteria bacterium]